MAEMISFGELLRHHRLVAGLSQEALAERAGLSTDAIRALERGRRTAPRAETLAMLANTLALSPPDRTFFVSAATGLALVSTATGLALPRDAPRPDDLPPRLLPVPLTALIGREGEVAAITQLFRADGARLVTLTGPGGVGKTRLALAVAHALHAAYPNGVTFVDLSALRDPLLIEPAMVQGLGLREDGAVSPREMLIEYLREKQVLLVLDNFEQVIEAASLLLDLIVAVPRLAVMVTSRIPLRLRGEYQFPVLPLATPGAIDLSLQEVGEYAAPRLFAERAQAVLPAFRLDAGNAAAVAEICRRLDGLPLAIELAAARVALLPPQTLLTRLEHRLTVLTRGARDLPERQQTLRATIDWSYALLSPWEQEIFRRLGVFAGGGTTDAAEAVVAALPGTGHGDVLNGLGALMEHSLLRSVGEPGREPRFWMLETLREYAQEQLTVAGEEEATRRSHAAYYLTLAATATPDHFYGPDQTRLLERLEQEHDNLRAVLAWARACGDAALGLRLAGYMWRFWYMRGHLREGQDWLQSLLALPAATATAAREARLECLVGLGNLAYLQTDYDAATAAAASAIAAARVLDEPGNLAMALNLLAAVARYRSDFAQAAALWEECLPLTQSIGNGWLRAIVLHNLADAACQQGAYERAATLAGESLVIAHERDDRWGIVQAELTLGEIARAQGNTGEAAARFTQALALARALDHRRDIALALSGLADVACTRGAYAHAAALVEESLKLLRPLGDKLRIAQALSVWGRVSHAVGDDARAIEVYRESLSLYRVVGNRLGVAASLEGLAAVVVRATIGATQQQSAHAVRLWGAAKALRAAIGAPHAPIEHEAYTRDVAFARTVLGAQAFAVAWAAGETASLEDLIADLPDLPDLPDGPTPS